jgi:ATP-binding cassette subfamily F protein uup
MLVSHDRVFLDHVVTSTLVFENGPVVQEYVGGYEDWVRQTTERLGRAGRSKEKSRLPTEARRVVQRARVGLSYKEQRELASLPERIEALEGEQRLLAQRIASADFYKEAAAAIHEALARQQELDREITSSYERWDELSSRG